MFHAAELFGQNVRLFLTEPTPQRGPPRDRHAAGPPQSGTASTPDRRRHRAIRVMPGPATPTWGQSVSRECPEIRDAVDFHSITGIVTYEQYERIIDGCRAAAEELAKRGGTCSLFEVEQLWSTGAPPGPCRCS